MVSVLVRVCLVVGLLTEFYSDIFVQLFAGRLPGQATAFMRWVPSYWFLGIYETVMGIAKPGMLALGKQAVLVSGATILISGLAYALCYQRIFMRLPETFDSMGSSRPFFRVRLPERLLRRFFRSPFERAVSSFAVKALLRSEQHLLFFGAYLGVGLVIVTQTALDRVTGKGPLPSGQALAIPLLAAFFHRERIAVYLRHAGVDGRELGFPRAANVPQPSPREVAKRLFLWATIPWEVLVFGGWMARETSWLPALAGTAVTVAFTVLFIDLLLLRFRKVPFACRMEVDIKQMLMKILGTTFAVLLLVPGLGAMERWMLLEPERLGWLVPVLGLGWWWVRRYRREMSDEDGVVQFEDGPAAAFELLKFT